MKLKTLILLRDGLRSQQLAIGHENFKRNARDVIAALGEVDAEIAKADAGASPKRRERKATIRPGG